MHFFRDSNGNEVDLLYGRGPNLVPIEIKSGQTIGSDWFKGIDHFARHFPATGGAVIYAGEASRHRSDGRAVLPVDELPPFSKKSPDGMVFRGPRDVLNQGQGEPKAGCPRSIPIPGSIAAGAPYALTHYTAAMIPSTVAAEVTGALSDFLVTGFSPSNPALANVVDDFLADADNLAKGPYLSIDLPFQDAPEGGEPFPEIPFGHTPHRHQRIAFGRLARGESSIVATGTGSGKTECFLYPVLEHCRAHAGEPGIKAIIIYPMNALASDQARRIAGIIHRTPSLNSRVTAGLYVGEGDASRRERMAPAHLVESREVLRKQPPDILLTNYKMLDLLLTRPSDFPLWQHNAAGTLRFLVVDELHTFDGAQGTGPCLPHPAFTHTAAGGRRG